MQQMTRMAQIQEYSLYLFFLLKGFVVLEFRYVAFSIEITKVLNYGHVTILEITNYHSF
jgi:hypothetical protein